MQQLPDVGPVDVVAAAGHCEEDALVLFEKELGLQHVPGDVEHELELALDPAG